ncbi:MAG TPA: hypothetical protein VH969_02525 [Actinophytocola sp.]|jgi:hypothetical protein|uniref:hypothetical protein n=1 Tax=Actinophytocola sp. TaxID=1872138 RepID=UPI002F936BC2
MLSDKVFLALTTTAAVVFTVLTTLAGWQWWVGLLVSAPVVAGGLFIKRLLEGDRHYEPAQPLPQAPPPPPPPQPASTRIQGLALPSKDRDYRFLLHATVLWLPSASATAGAQLSRQDHQVAIDAIRERATRQTQDLSASDLDLVGPRIATELSYPLVDRSGEFEVWAQDVVLTLPDLDLERLRELARLRKNAELWEAQRLEQRNLREYLHDDVFTSTGSAVVWWLSRDVTKVEETVALIGKLAQLTATANNREVDALFRPFVDGPVVPHAEVVAPASISLNGGGLEPVRRLMAQTLPDSTEPERALMADQLATLVANLGADELAREIRLAFNAPSFAEVDTEPEPVTADQAAEFDFGTDPASRAEPDPMPDAADPDTADGPQTDQRGW